MLSAAGLIWKSFITREDTSKIIKTMHSFSKHKLFRFIKEVPMASLLDKEFKKEGVTRMDLTIKYLVKKKQNKAT